MAQKYLQTMQNMYTQLPGWGRSSHEKQLDEAGAIAKKILSSVAGVEIGYVKRIRRSIPTSLTPLESNIVRCPDSECAEQMIEQLSRWDGKGILSWWNASPARCQRLGSPVFDKLEADIAKGVMSLPATKGWFRLAGTLLTGSASTTKFIPTTNRSGGVQGGISNGENIILRVAFKPTATIRKSSAQWTARVKRRTSSEGTHDPACCLERCRS